ncbi:MAG: tetratricopeptide repeat protein [bacterium]
MKKIGGLVLVYLLVIASSVWALEGVFDRENLSLKSGPTQPGEQLSLAWVESFVFPKSVKEDKAISLGVRTTSKVLAVMAIFDFTSKQVALSSKDGRSWSGVYRLPSNVANGLHVVRYLIVGKKGSIKRTVEFCIESPKSYWSVGKKLEEDEMVANTGWPLTVVSTCAAYSGSGRRILYAGQVITGSSKTAWYKVVFDDGKEGWVPASYVKEPTEDYYYLGSVAYNAKNYTAAIKHYKNAITVDPNLAKGYLGLAKSYDKLGELESAFNNLKMALKIDDRDPAINIYANDLSLRLEKVGHGKFKAKRYNEAIALFRKATELKDDSLASWKEMGDSFRQLGMMTEANNAWREALKLDPDNVEMRAKLKLKNYDAVAAKPKTQKIAPMLAKESINMIRGEKTNKGTNIDVAIKSVIGLTKSLGTPVVEKGWQVKKKGEKFIVSYLCTQGGGALESFDWLVDVDTRQTLPHNENARLLMSRW